MKRVILVLVVLTLLVAGALLGYFYRQLHRPAPRAVDLLPDSTLVFLHAPDCAQTRAEFAATRLAALAREPAIQALLAEPLQALTDAVQNAGPSPDVLLQQIRTALQGELFVAVTHLATVPKFKVGLVVGSDVRHNLLLARTSLARFGRRLRQAYPQARFESLRHNGIAYEVWEVRAGLTVCHAFLNTLVVITLDEDDLRAVIDRFTSPTAPALAAQPAFRDVRDQMPAGHEFLAYVNVEPLAGLLAPVMMFAPQGAGLVQKLQQLRAAGYSLTFTNGDIQDVTVLAYHTGPPATNPPTTHPALALTTPATLLYAAGTTDLATGYQELLDSLAQTRNPQFTDAVINFERVLRNQGVRLRNDVLARLGPEVALLANWRPGARLPDFAVVLQTRNLDRPALDATGDALWTAWAGDEPAVPWETTTVAGEQFRTVHLGAAVLAPTYFAVPPRLIVASTPDFARELLNQLRHPHPTLADHLPYQTAMARLPRGGTSCAYADLPVLVPRLLTLLKSYGQRLPANAYFDLHKLPPPEVFAQHLSPYVATTVTGPRHILTTSYSPVSAPSFVLGGVGLGAALTYGNFSAFAPSMSSDTAVPPAPRENQTAVSQTPIRQ